MVLKSYAKVNLSLSVNKKLKNGLHNLQSFFCLINLFDKIYIKKIKNVRNDKILFTGPFSNYIKKSDNTIKSLLLGLRKHKLINDFYYVKVYKKIPVFSGLGGGSSNAASILKFLFKKKIKKRLIDDMAKHVGTDLRLFFYKQGFLKNIKTVEKLKKKHKLYFLLVYPKIGLSTKKVYSKVKKLSTRKIINLGKLKSRKIFKNLIIRSQNDLQSIVEKNHPSLKNLLTNISSEKGCYLSRLSGSGSTCYGLFNNENCSKAALSALRKRYPKFWFSTAKTI